jgi:N-acetylmuramoyl-L-alanine amidase
VALTFRLGDVGPAVAEIRDRLVRLGVLPLSGHNSDVPSDGDRDGDDVFDASMDTAIRHFQQQFGITADGIVGPQTFRRLEEARWRLGDRLLAYQPGHPVIGDDVAELQRRLNDLGFDPERIDGVFATRTDKALREFQRNVGLIPDGIAGPATFKALDQLRRAVVGGQPHLLREDHRWESSRTGVADKVVVLDPGHGGLLDPGTTHGPLRECEIAEDIASRVEGRLAALGVTVLLTRGRSEDVPDALDQGARAAFANDTGADVVISMHVDSCRHRAASGVSGFFYGNDRHGASSSLGRRLTETLLDEVCARTDLPNLRAHGRTWDLLRLTRMTAVRLELGYLSNEHDRSMLEQAAFRDALADGLSHGIVSFFSPSAVLARA